MPNDPSTPRIGSPIAPSDIRPAESQAGELVPSLPPPIEQHAFELAKDTFTHVQDLVKTADAKAIGLVAFQGLVLIILGSSLGADVITVIRRGGSAAYLLMIVGGLMLVSTVVSVLASIAVISPRNPKHVRQPAGARGLMWIEAINSHAEQPDGYLAELRTTSEQARLADLAFENLKVAWILQRKFLFLKLAMRVLVVSFITWIVFLAAAVITNPT
jgi:hypothetical protein